MEIHKNARLVAQSSESHPIRRSAVNHRTAPCLSLRMEQRLEKPQVPPPNFNMDFGYRRAMLGYNKLSGSISTSTAVSGMSFASQYAIAPPSSFVSTERFGDFSRNWNRCSFFNRASGAVAGPRMRTPLSSCGEKYSESCRDHRMALSRLVSRTITFASEVNGGYAIIRRKCNSRSKNET